MHRLRHFSRPRQPAIRGVRQCRRRRGPIRMDQTGLQGLTIAPVLREFVEQEALPGTGIDAARFWSGYAALLARFTARNTTLLARRDVLQARIDAWHEARRGQPHDAAAYAAFLAEIGYLQPQPQRVAVGTAHVDDEIGRIAGPQLVVPASNARYALNAANARWGSLYDALYGTDAIPETDGAERGSFYNPRRGANVVARAKAMLDEIAPLARGSHADATGYAVKDGALVTGEAVPLADPSLFAGWTGDAGAPAAGAAAPSRAASRDGAGPRASDRPRRSGGPRRHHRGIGTHHHRRSGGQRRDRRCRGQGAGLSQLARPDAGHAVRALREGRPRDGAPAARGSRLRRTRRRHRHAARPQPAAGAQCGAPPDDRRRARCQRARDVRDGAGLRRDRPDRHARSAARRRRDPQQPHRARSIS